MANSYVEIPVTGVDSYAFPFPYIEQSHIKVYAGGVLQTQGVHYTFTDSNTIEFLVGNIPTDTTTVILIQRVTDNSGRLVTYSNTGLDADDLNLGSKQNFFLAQEAIDSAALNITKGADGITSVDGRLTNVEDPIDAQDAATKAYVASQLTASANGSVYMQSTPPLPAAIGDLWVDTDTQVMSVYTSSGWANGGTVESETFHYTGADLVVFGFYHIIPNAALGTANIDQVFLNGVFLKECTTSLDYTTGDWDRTSSVVTFENALAADDVITITTTTRMSELLATAIVNVNANLTNILQLASSGSVNGITLKEQFTATAGQQVFNLTNSYAQAQNNISVYVNGVLQSAYVETSTSSVTLSNPASLGDEVVFIINEHSVSTTVTEADNVNYTPAGTGAVATTVQEKLQETVSVKDFGAVGDGVTDDAAPFSSATDSTNGTLIIPEGTYSLGSPDTYNNLKITGDYLPTLEPTVVNGALGILKNNVLFENITLNGKGGTSLLYAVGGTSYADDNIWIKNNIIVNAVGNTFRLNSHASKVSITGNQVSNSKLFNTLDWWQGKDLLVCNNIVSDVAGEAGLFEAPAYKADWHGVVHNANIYTAAVGGDRLIGHAGTKGFVDSNNIYRGAAGLTKDVFHIEDLSEFGVASGNLISANGAAAAVDCALGGDPNYLHFESASGSFTIGETVTGSTSGATGVVESLITPEVLKLSSYVGTFKSLETLTGVTSGVGATVSRRDPTSILLTGNAIFPDGAKGIEMEGPSPSSFEKITLSNNHIEESPAPIKARLDKSIIMGNVIHDAGSPIRVIKSDGSVNNTESKSGHDVLVPNNHYINQKFIRGDVGLCFDPTNIIFRTSFADEGASLTFGGSVGTGGTITYPLSVAGDGIAGVKYLRATGGTTAMTRRVDVDFDSTTSDIQNGDTISVQVMCRSSTPNRGRVDIGVLSSGLSTTSFDLETTTDWQVLGATKNIPSTADLFSAGADNILIDLFLGEDLGNGETLDIAWVKVSHVRSY